MVLEGKTAYITGASGGIGSAIARELYRRGCRVALFRHDDDYALKLAEELGAGAVAVYADVADSASVDRAFSLAERELGAADILVNNAGAAHFGLLQDCSDEEYEHITGVNMKGVFNCCRRILPGMISAKRGCIVNISSMWGVSGAACESVYSAAKAGVIGLTVALAKEVAPSGITVNCIAPGVIDTKMNAHLDKEAIADVIGQTPMGRLGTPEDIAGAVAYLVSAPFVTGQTLCVDGGFLL